MAIANPEDRNIEQEILEKLYAFEMTHGKAVEFCEEFLTLPSNQVDAVFIDFLISNDIPGDTAVGLITAMAGVKAEAFLKPRLYNDEDFNSAKIQKELRSETRLKNKDLLENYIRTISSSEVFDQKAKEFNEKEFKKNVLDIVD